MRLLLLILLFSNICFAQEIQYFNSTFSKASVIETKHKRIYEFEKNSVKFKDFYKEKTLLQEGEIYGLTNIEEINGFVYYSMNRAREYHFKPNYKNAKGHFSFYISNQDFTSVRKYCEIIVENAKQKYSQIWDSKQNEILKNGTGIDSVNLSTKNIKNIYYYKDSILTKAYSINLEKKDTIHLIHDKMASPKNGMDDFYNSLDEYIKKSKFPKDYYNKEIMIDVQFVVEKDGSFSEIKISPDEYDIESYFIKFLKKYPNWNPGIVNNKPIRSYYSLPVKLLLFK